MRNADDHIPVFREVSLYSGAKKNEEQFVAAVKVPRYEPLPDVILWGDKRYFQKAISNLKNRIVYHEVQVYVANEVN